VSRFTEGHHEKTDALLAKAQLETDEMQGCQSEGIAATPKHFVANDSEKRRTKMTSEVDEQTLREIYMLPFQLVMREADPWCLMTS
jgi:beta-glucosidase